MPLRLAKGAIRELRESGSELLKRPAIGEEPIEDGFARKILEDVLLDATVDERQAENRGRFSGMIAAHLLHPHARISGKFLSISVGRRSLMELVCQRFAR